MTLWVRVVYGVVVVAPSEKTVSPAPRYCGRDVVEEDAVHLPLASSRAQTARWAAVRGGAASGGVGDRVVPSPAVRAAGTGRPTACCVARGKVSAAFGKCDDKAL